MLLVVQPLLVPYVSKYFFIIFYILSPKIPELCVERPFPGVRQKCIIFVSYITDIIILLFVMPFDFADTYFRPMRLIFFEQPKKCSLDT